MITAMRYNGGGLSVSKGTIGFYFHDGADYVPGLDAGQARVWFAEPNDQMFHGHLAMTHWSPDEMRRFWEEVPDDEPVIPASAVNKLLAGQIGPGRPR